MTSRANVVPGLLSAVATIIIAVPLSRLFDEASWLLPAAVGVLLVAGTGMLLRWSTSNTGWTILGQLLVAVLYVLVTQLGDTTRLGVLPTGETVGALVEHVRDAQDTITRYAAPAPETAGITVMLILIVIVVGLAVDMSAATAASPAIAGLPLLSLFLVSAANSGGSLPWGWFLVGAALWLTMVTHQSGVDLREWTTAIPLLGHGDGQDIAQQSLRWQAVRVSAIGIAAAMLLPAVMPHLPTRYVLDGLGGGGAGSAGSTDGIRLSTELDLKRSLESPSEDPVLRYTTDEDNPEPLRVAVVEDFTDGFGRMRSRAREPREGFTPRDAIADVPDEIKRRHTLVVNANGVAAPQMAVPAHVSSVDTDGVAWALGRDGTARVQRTPATYSATFTQVTPEEQHFGRDTADEIDPTADRDDNLALDPGSAEQIQSLSDRLAPQDASDLEAAQAYQEYLRGTDFTYSLDIPQPANGPADPILSFLETKTGYCQQFAATMTLLARARDIPARVVVGFLPGDVVDGEERVVRASDAHAWPELYFEGVGWVRFEPTKGTRAARVPGYSINTTEGGTDATDSSTSETASSTSTSTATETDDTDVATPQDGDDEGVGRWLRWLGIALLALAALAIVPVTALLARRRVRASSSDDGSRVEQEWQDLIERLADLGVEPPPGSTPRHVGDWLGRRAHLDDEVRGQLDHVVTTLERARYGRPGQELPDISAEVSSVVGEVREQRMRSVRLRAALWPRAGVDAWAGLPRRTAERLRRRSS